MFWYILHKEIAAVLTWNGQTHSNNSLILCHLFLAFLPTSDFISDIKDVKKEKKTALQNKFLKKP